MNNILYNFNMHRFSKLSIAAFLFNVIMSSACVAIPHASATYAPLHVHVNDSVFVTYNLKDPTSAFPAPPVPTLYVYIFENFPDDPKAPLRPLIKEIRMSYSDTLWTASFAMDVPDAKYFMFRFASMSAEDNNNGEFWQGLIWNAHNKPVQNACAIRACCEYRVAADSTYQMIPAFRSALRDAEEEVRLYPDNIYGWDIYFHLKKDSVGGFSSQFVKQIDSMLHKFVPAVTEHTVPRLSWWFIASGQMDKAKQFDDAWVSAHPDKSNYTFLVRFNRARTIKDAEDIIIAITNLLHASGGESGYGVRAGWEYLVIYYLQSDSLAQAEQALRQSHGLSPMLYDRIANRYLDDNAATPIMLRHALLLEDSLIARESVDSTLMQDSSLAERDKMMRENAMIGKFYGTAGRLALRLNDEKTALHYLSNGVMSSRLRDADLNSLFLNCLLHAGAELPDSAKMLIMPLAMSAMQNDSLWVLYKQVTQNMPSMQPQLDRFDKMRQNASRIHDILRQQDFCKNIYRAIAPDFSLPAANGTTVTLKSLKGKTIVLDFWGSWCQTCVYTLPRVDSVYKQFASNDSVAFFAVDCGEQNKSLDSLRKGAKNYMEQLGVTIPVLFDVKNKMVDSFDVQVFPTEIIIDKNGIIRSWHPKAYPEDITEALQFELPMLIGYGCDRH